MPMKLWHKKILTKIIVAGAAANRGRRLSSFSSQGSTCNSSNAQEVIVTATNQKSLNLDHVTGYQPIRDHSRAVVVVDNSVHKDQLVINK